MMDIPENKDLILFDGVCNLCSSSVQYVIERDHKNKYVFAALQSDIGKEIIEKYKIDSSKTDSILLYRKDKGVVSKSTAALLIAKHLGFPTNLLYVFLIVPAFIRNMVYDYVAKNRYKWYGKKESCWIPTPELKAKFID
ncbi:thiol-disulfide oxidoreductase DCC family protein [Aurantibacter aestuarii]|uniref:Thiol-disulfide oxidoreductase n=1 Tax=Aurantibacter aestuarii TaxID=1266046 RepID=A0A2T1N8R4_9FLAO|nr:DCC1-like thiol-disulfide oxidoreductase family protein [Aurantibacter aestuarii]PSG88266.1 thiol-disulfide oxidoreductase [Aurantibacter aestuarii]